MNTKRIIISDIATNMVNLAGLRYPQTSLATIHLLLYFLRRNLDYPNVSLLRQESDSSAWRCRFARCCGFPGIRHLAGAHAQIPPPLLPAAAPEEPSAGPVTCTINFIAVFNNRVVLRCVEPLPSTVIFDFAAPIDTANSAKTNRYLTLLNTAYALGKQVHFYYLSDSTSNPPGCITGTCRRLDGLYLD